MIPDWTSHIGCACKLMTCCAPVDPRFLSQIFRLMQLLRLFSMYRQYEARRSMQRVMREGAQLVRDDTMSMAEMELHNSQTQDTRVGQRLERRF